MSTQDVIRESEIRPGRHEAAWSSKVNTTSDYDGTHRAMTR